MMTCQTPFLVMKGITKASRAYFRDVDFSVELGKAPALVGETAGNLL